MSDRKPNVVLINCDDLGYGDLGCYGSAANKSPYVDKLALSGVRFTSFYAASPVCSPSRAALMTGCHHQRVGMNRVLFPGESQGLCPNEHTMPKMFKDAGYATMMVGKWHLGDQNAFLPTKFGFDSYYGLPYSNDMGAQEGGISVFDSVPLPLLLDDEVISQQPDQRALTERYAEKCVEFVRKNKSNPFFLYFAQMHVHLPLYAADRFVKESANGDFGACVASLDWACGAIMRELETLGLIEDTLIIFTSDNGARGDYGSSNAPLRGSKFSTWEGGLRVPCIISWEGRIKPGENDGIFSNIDLLPTLASIACGRLGGKKIDGLDFSPTLLNGAPSPRSEFVYCQSSVRRESEAKKGTGGIEAVRRGRWKLHLYKNGESVKLLYDLEADAAESVNLYDENANVAAELTEIFESYRRELGDGYTGTIGEGVRGCGFVPNPVPLTVYDPDHPYICALYDKSERG